MRLIPPSETARRVRAALAYSGLEQPDVVAQTGIGLSTLRRMVARDDPRRASLEELQAIADACKVPRWFMENGWRPETTALEQQLADLEVIVRQLDAERRDLREDLRQDLLAELGALAGEAVARALRQGQLPKGEEGDANASDEAEGG